MKQATIVFPGIDLDVTLVPIESKKGQEICNKWIKHSNDEHLSDVYVKPSIKKRQAYLRIEEEMKQTQGGSLRITGAGPTQLSIAYKTWDIEGKAYLIYHTSVNRFAVPLS
jgi:hypothetical protein